MRFVDELRDAERARPLAAQIAALCEADCRYHVMEVCGGHTHTVYRHGIDDYLPENVSLVHGPGCPVCVIPMGSGRRRHLRRRAAQRDHDPHSAT